MPPAPACLKGSGDPAPPLGGVCPPRCGTDKAGGAGRCPGVMGTGDSGWHGAVCASHATISAGAARSRAGTSMGCGSPCVAPMPAARRLRGDTAHAVPGSQTLPGHGPGWHPKPRCPSIRTGRPVARCLWSPTHRCDLSMACPLRDTVPAHPHACLRRRQRNGAVW